MLPVTKFLSWVCFFTFKGGYSSYNEIKEQAALFEIPGLLIAFFIADKMCPVARMWPSPANLTKLTKMQETATGLEGFVTKMTNGTMIKCKTNWWKQQKHQNNVYK